VFDFLKKTPEKKEYYRNIRIIRTRKRVKTISIKIKNSTAEICCPIFTTKNQIRLILDKKMQWIKKKIDEQPKQLKFKEGLVLDFIEKKVIVTFLKGKNFVNLEGKKLLISSSKDSMDFRKKLANKWFIFQSRKYLTQRLCEISNKLDINYESVSIKGYKARWGCCSYDGRIILNWKLIFLPKRIIDYVIIHELCHVLEKNHSPKFWKLVESFNPDFKNNKKWLKKYGTTFILF